MDSPYNVLGVAPGAGDDAVRDAYRSLMKSHHPDQGGTTEEFIRIKKAYESIQADDAAARAARARAGRRASTDGGTATCHPGAGAGAEATIHDDSTAITCTNGVGLELRGEYLTLRLVGVDDSADLAKLVADHALPADGDDDRPVAFLTVENTSDRTVRWRGTQSLSFVGSDDNAYESAEEYRPSEPKLPDGWTGSDIAVESGEELRVVVIAEALAEDVEIRGLQYTQNVFARGPSGRGIEDKERFSFEIAPSAKPLLARAPF
ncbi:DnaJ domain-containing protein [Natronoarchaeum philippinense]|uniref:DnaJ domain-containing protein n=1 Tax=Natronoarchaeum philippinense TaxID=558529 RepID=A0A285N305_NATPI|nr:DnaJ domain-containing protein [Natronoarchaeum philippinense]SNZ03810.1 DnaJ domain-containing protein [Natronoarchaeum philippinense]